MSHLEDALAYARAHQDDALNELKDFLRIASISTLPEHKPEMDSAATWLVERLRKLGFKDASILPSGGHPIVFGELAQAGPEAPTILFYGHYDVQPADPFELWESDPFNPLERNGYLYARGASDMKGQVVAHLSAIEAMTQSGSLPVNLKYMIEGEEEIGSPSLEKFIREHTDRLQADFCLNADGQILAAETPSLTYALRGLNYFEIRVSGPSKDLHSGQYGGAVANPATVLVRLLAGMHDDQGRVTLPGFYDRVRELTEDEREQLAKLPTDESWWLEQTGAKAIAGEAGYSATELATARPTLDVNGLLSGFTGEGSKTVLPATAMAKISMRLVADQSPLKVKESLLRYLEENTPPTVDYELLEHSSSPPGHIDRSTRPVQAASEALEEVWGTPSLFKREGGTVPVVGHLKEILDLDSLVLGFGLPDDNLHSPNERFLLHNFYRGIETFIRFTHKVAEPAG